MDLSKIKEKLTTLNKQSSSNSKLIWKPEEGKNLIRILPYMHDRSWPFSEIFFYYKMASKTLVSPTSYGQPDPIVEFAESLKTTGVKEDWVQGAKLMPKLRTFVPIIVRGKESEGVKFWGFAKTVFQELLTNIEDPEVGDITDLKEGRDVEVTFTKKAGSEFGDTSIRLKMSKTKATTDPEVLEKIKTMPAIEEIYPSSTYEELEEALARYLDNSESPKEETESKKKVETLEDDDDFFSAVEKPNEKEKEVAEVSDLPFDQPAKKTSSKNDIKSNAKSNLEDAFDDMFND